MNKKTKTILIWIALVAVFMFVLMNTSSGRRAAFVPFEGFVGAVDEGAVGTVFVDGSDITIESRIGGPMWKTVGNIDAALMEKLAGAGVEVRSGKPPLDAGGWIRVALPWICIALVLLWLLKRSQAGGVNIMAFGKSRARELRKEDRVTFADVGGLGQAKTELGDIIDYLKDPAWWERSGVRPPRGVLLEGPPGCGKSLLARAVAGESSAKFTMVAASEFVEMFVGVGAARVRDLFDTAAKTAPSIVFIDELDAVGRRRGSGIGSGHDEREQTLNQLLVCLDSCGRGKPVVVIGATNRVDILDTALLRPGRFDRRIRIGSLDMQERLAVLRIYAANKTLAPDVSLEQLAQQAEGWTGAALETMVNEAAQGALRRARQQHAAKAIVAPADFEQARAELLQRGRRYGALDALLVESASQLAEPLLPVQVRIMTAQGERLEGEAVWVDATFVKIRCAGGIRMVAKRQIAQIEPLGEQGGVESVRSDAWAAARPDTM